MSGGTSEMQAVQRVVMTVESSARAVTKGGQAREVKITREKQKTWKGC